MAADPVSRADRRIPVRHAFRLERLTIDAVTSPAIVYCLVREGREAWRGDDCRDDARP
jgi:hypothetical protein